MTDPGYGKNGEVVPSTGIVSWQANAPPIPVTEGYDIQRFFPLGVRVIPFIDQNDDETWKHLY